MGAGCSEAGGVGSGRDAAGVCAGLGAVLSFLSSALVFLSDDEGDGGVISMAGRFGFGSFGGDDILEMIFSLC